MADEPGDITKLLRAAADDPAAAAECLSRVYDELRELSRRQLSRQSPNHTLQPTALVHEAYLKIAGANLQDLTSRKHFFSLAARAMRQILVDHARTKRRAKRGGGETQRVPLDAVVAEYEERVGDLETLATALDALRDHDEEKARLVELRVFAELTFPQIAEITETPLRSVERQWAMARGWLRTEMNGQDARA